MNVYENWLIFTNIFINIKPLKIIYLWEIVWAEIISTESKSVIRTPWEQNPRSLWLCQEIYKAFKKDWYLA